MLFALNCGSVMDDIFLYMCYMLFNPLDFLGNVICSKINAEDMNSSKIRCDAIYGNMVICEVQIGLPYEFTSLFF